MSKKKTISFKEYVLDVAEEKAKEMFGGNLSSYLSWLICYDNKAKVEKTLEELELRKPKRISEFRLAMFDSDCPYCGKRVKSGDAIYDVILPSGVERFVHKNCSRESK